MKRIAVIADIHANPFALRAVLDHIATQGVDEVIVAGDLVGRGPLGDEVVRLISECNLQGVRGNHEDYLIAFRNREVPKAWLEIQEWSCARWMAAELSEGAFALIESLPFSRTSVAEPTMRVVHGSPRSNNEGIGPWTNQETLKTHLNSIHEDLLVCAHTHRPGIWKVDDRLIVNVGSVGLPFNRDPRAQYATFEKSDQSWHVDFHQVEYDRQPFLEAYEATGFLAAGGATSRLLRMEVEHATPYLVPFLKWAEILERRPLAAEIDGFLDFHQPELSLKAQYKRLLTLREDL